MPIKLSDITDSIEYIPLETNTQCFIKHLNGIIITSDRIFVQDGGGNVLQFASNGKFIGTIGRKGNGPGGYGAAGCIDVDEDSRLFRVFSIFAHSILHYDMDGKFLYSRRVPRIFNGGMLNEFHFLTANQWIATQDRSNTTSNDTAVVVNTPTNDYQIISGAISGMDWVRNGVYIRKPMFDAV